MVVMATAKFSLKTKKRKISKPPTFPLECLKLPISTLRLLLSRSAHGSLIFDIVTYTAT